MSVELFVGLVVIVGVGYWLYTRNSKKDDTTESTTDTTYKVETPAVAEPKKCGCGRSPSGYCVGLHSLTESEWATHADNPNKVEAPADAKPAKAKKPSAPKVAKASKPKTAAKKPATKKPKLKTAK